MIDNRFFYFKYWPFWTQKTVSQTIFITVFNGLVYVHIFHVIFVIEFYI